jgi:tetratricopeptide (TPR) repeat protein
MGHTKGVTGVCFNSDGTRLASAGLDDTVRIWESGSGQELLTIKNDTGVPSVFFSPDGTRLASPSADTVKVWETVPAPAALLRQREIVSWVHALLGHLRFREDAVEQLRRDPALTEGERNLAIHVARTHREPTPEEWNNASRRIVTLPWQVKAAYVLALRQAEMAVRLVQDNGNYLITLGIAQYRIGDYAKALGTLTQAANLNSTRGEDLRPEGLAFLAMAQHQLGKNDEAKVTLARLREVMKQPHWARKAGEAQGFLREAEELFQGKAAGGK